MQCVVVRNMLRLWLCDHECELVWVWVGVVDSVGGLCGMAGGGFISRVLGCSSRINRKGLLEEYLMVCMGK